MDKLLQRLLITFGTNMMLLPNRRNVVLGLPALIATGIPNQADALLPGLLIRSAGRAVSGFFLKTGVRRTVSTTANRSAQRGLQRMESSGFKKYREEFTGGLAHGTGSAIGEAVTTHVISAVRPQKTNGVVYCAAIGTDCSSNSACRQLQETYPAEGDGAVTGGFQEIDKQVILIEEANALGLDWVASKRESQGWSNEKIASVYFPVGFVRREIGRTGEVREQSIQYLTPQGTVTTEERIDYARGSGHVNLTAYSHGEQFDDYFSFSH